MRSKNDASSITHFATTLKDATLIEQSIGSKDISYEYTVGIDTSLYPNKPGFRLTKVKRFLRPGPVDGIDYTIEYFATSDGSIRTILHEWNVAKELHTTADDSSIVFLDSPQTEIIRAFKEKFDNVDSILTASLGLPIYKDIKDNFLEEIERDDIKWTGQNQLNAYLLMFKRDDNTYRQIRLIIYPR
jgi:hypothetical protein